jgi:hypothetical protein
MAKKMIDELDISGWKSGTSWRQAFCRIHIRAAAKPTINGDRAG